MEYYDHDDHDDIIYKLQECKNGEEILKIVKNHGLDVSYIYDCMINKKVVNVIEELMLIFSKRIEFLYNFLDGWIDFWSLEKTDISKIYACKVVHAKFKNVLIKFIRLDHFNDIKNEYITILKNHFDINFYGETMMG